MAHQVGKLVADNITASATAGGTVPPTGTPSGKFLRDDNTWATAAGGSGNAVAVVVGFGSGFTDKAQAVVTGQSWVEADSVIVASVLCPSGADPDEMYLLNLRPTVSDLVVGDGFTVTVYSEPQASGNYTVHCIGV